MRFLQLMIFFSFFEKRKTHNKKNLEAKGVSTTKFEFQKIVKLMFGRGAL